MGTKKWVARPDIQSFILAYGATPASKNVHFGENLFHDRELVEWCNQNGCNVHRQWIECKSDEAYLLFKMRFL